MRCRLWRRIKRPTIDRNARFGFATATDDRRMKRSLASLPTLGLDGKRALVRVDFNVPLADGKVTDDTRIRAALPTIAYLRDKGARVVLCSHLGRPKGGPDPRYSLKPVATALEGLLGAPVTFMAAPLAEGSVITTKRPPRGGVPLLENPEPSARG